ncbi:MAG TPA: nucleoside deaminase [Candidatus Gallacutalibacter pullistercoris]|nr:nucleoside deaminase [Candidatus Gallacutalibacter pullistercoris]
MKRSFIPAKEPMLRALELAREAGEEGEVPVGAVIVCEGKIIAEGRNRREADKNALCHAEIEAIHNACRTLGGWRLWQCELYVTLEPCPMCAGAIINARIPQVVYGAADDKAGSCGSIVDLFELPYNHHPQVTAGFMQEEAAALLQDFFRRLREKRKAQKEQKRVFARETKE